MTFADYAQDARQCDLALWRPHTYWGRYIARYTRGRYSHITGLVHWSDADQWMSCGYEERRGGFAEPLEACVAKYPGQIDIWRVKDRYWPKGKDCRRCVAERLVKDLGGDYGWRAIWRIVAPVLPIIGLFQTVDEHAETVRAASNTRPSGICSQHVHRSFLDCGIYLANGESELITPNDIARSSMLELIGTLT